MRIHVRLIAAFMSISACGSIYAQTGGSLEAPQTIGAGQPFQVYYTLLCLPQTEAPPPFDCNLPTHVKFQSSDPAATLPSPIELTPPSARLLVSSGFILRSPGIQTIYAVVGDNRFISGTVDIAVLDPVASPAPALNWLGAMFMLVGLTFFASTRMAMSRG
jgi:hypothetical protein